LKSIDKDALGAIETEIELLQKLHHKNIVKYIDTIRSKNHLYIVLEFIESGSLSALVKDHGTFPEVLVAKYIKQVLHGLQYLHEQGVLHRDIKGANILVTKGGDVKLADFGVAVSIADAHVDEVVGTPYWIAPEIIEMSSTPTTACDIWSVGCTVIELLTGNPPYFDLAPMTALFRIVQDDYPPLPHGISPALRDFLLLCFQKEPVLRCSAITLLAHAWIKNCLEREKNSKSKENISTSISKNDIGSKNSKTTIQQHSSQLNDEAIAPRIRSISEGNLNVNVSKTKQIQEEISPPPIDESLSTPQKDQSNKSKSIVIVDNKDIKKDVPITNTVENKEDHTNLLSSLSPTPSPYRMTHFVTSSELSTPITENSKLPLDQTPESSFMSSSALKLKQFREEDEDIYSDLETAIGDISTAESPKKGKEINNENAPKLTKPKLKTSFDKGLILNNGENDVISQKLVTRMKNAMNGDNKGEDIDELRWFQFEDDYFEQNDMKNTTIRGVKDAINLMEKILPDSKEEEVRAICLELIRLFANNPDLREHIVSYEGVMPILLMFENQSRIGPNGTVSPYVLKIINIIMKDSKSTKEQLALMGIVPPILRILENGFIPQNGLHSTHSLFSLFPLSNPPTVVEPLIKEAAYFVHQMTFASSLTLQLLLSAGVLPVLVQLMAYSSLMITQLNSRSIFESIIRSGSHEGLLDRESSKVISSHMVVSEDAKKLVYMGIDCVQQVFNVQSSRTRDFGHLFVRMGLLPHLALAFQYLIAIFLSTIEYGTSDTVDVRNDNEQSEEQLMLECSTYIPDPFCTMENRDWQNESIECKYSLVISSLLVRLSLSDSWIAQYIVKEGGIILSIQSLHEFIVNWNNRYSNSSKKNVFDTSANQVEIELPAACVEIMERLLRIVKNLSMEPSVLGDLERAGVIQIVVPLLDGPISDRCKIYVLPIIFNLCRLNKRRQDIAVMHGIIPHLQSLIIENSHLRQFALPVFCYLARASATTRMKLWENDSLDLYVRLLRDDYWQTHILNSIAIWLANDLEAVQNVLVEPVHMSNIIEFFRSASMKTIHSIHKPLLDMMNKSSDLCQAFSCSGLFISSLIKRLSTANEAIVLRSLLRMLQLIHQHHPSPRQLVLDLNLYHIVLKFVQDSSQVLVYQAAVLVLKDFQNSTIS